MEIVRYNGYKLYLRENFHSYDDLEDEDYTLVFIDNPVFVRSKKWYKFLCYDRHLCLGQLDYHITDCYKTVDDILNDLGRIIKSYQKERSRRRQLRRLICRLSTVKTN